MSAIEITDRALTTDGVRRYHTTCKVRVDSHNLTEPVYLSEDVQTIQMSKSIKGAGKANLTLLASKNYLNLIHPNDYVNIYFNTGDGEGWTRTFFGFIDRIEEFYEVSADGKPITKYQLVCSDFFKAVERTMIYFNPHLSGRPDLDGSFVGTPNIGGLALMTRGIKIHGSPADVVQNNILLTLGFGSQFLLPPSYPRTLVDALRRERAEFAQGQLGADVRQAIANAGTYEQFREKLLQESRGIAQDVAGQYDDPTEITNALRAEYGLKELGGIDSSQATDIDALSRIVFNQRATALLRPEEGAAGSFDQRTFNLLESTVSDNASLLDVLDVFTFVERDSMDGYDLASSTWQKQGSVMSIIGGLSHEAMNEMIFDLRPLTATDDGYTEGEYSRAEDDLSENVSDGLDPNGIRYVPALVMREYPFSTIDGLDLSGVSTGLHGQYDTEESIGVLYFGPIFSNEPNVPGRHVVSGPAISWEKRVGGEYSGTGRKHLDVAVITEQEIIRSQLGRSDAEHYNLFEFYSDALLGEDQRYYMNDLLPIITPIHVLRHGLRVRSVTTRFARFSIGAAKRGRKVVKEEEAVEAEEATEEAAPEPSDSSELPVVARGDITTPVLASDGPRYWGGPVQRWGYRFRTGRGTSGFRGWVFHHGIDIGSGLKGSTPEAKEIPVYAVADGDVVLSAPTGCYGGYGNIIIIKHKFAGYDGFIYTSYNHLTSRVVGVGKDVEAATPRARSTYAAPGAPGVFASRMSPIRVRKGQLIGYMGNTGTTDQGKATGVHLHFEFVRNHPPRHDDLVPRSTEATPPENDAKGRSIDPEVFYEEQGYNLVSLLTSGPADAASEEEESDVDEDLGESGNDAVPREDVIEPETSEVETPTEGIVVDSALSRAQIIRWALLQDHWYQHNLEYLSGRIDMHGAPEIRVGYRLDWNERNMSFYVEGVNHSWNFPDKMVTSIQVTRGQPNKPYPLYVTPKIESFSPTGTQRTSATSRLAQYFVTPDPRAIRRALVLRQAGHYNVNNITGSKEGNVVDQGVISEGIATAYNERVVSDSDRSATQVLSEDKRTQDLLDIVDSAIESLDRVSGQAPTAPVDPENPLGGTGG